MSDIDSDVESSIDSDLNDGRTIKEIVKEASKEYAKAKGRALFFWGWKKIKAEKREKSGDPKKRIKLRLPDKRVSSLRPGDITEFGEVRMVGTSPVQKGHYEVTFVGDRGVSVQTLKGTAGMPVIERRSIR